MRGGVGEVTKALYDGLVAEMMQERSDPRHHIEIYA